MREKSSSGKNKSALLFFLWLLCFGRLSLAQQTETISLAGKDVEVSEKGFRLQLKNWELIYPESQNQLPFGKTGKLTKKSRFFPDSIDFSKYKGIAWLKKTFRTDNSFSAHNLAMEFQMYGAADVFLNRKLIRRLGAVGISEDSETLLRCEDKLAFVKLENNSEYELLIRYSNHQITAQNQEVLFGVNVFIKESERTVFGKMSDDVQNTAFAAMIITGFLTLAILHLIIFLFNRDQKGNVYYSVFCALVALVFTGTSLNRFYSSAVVEEWTSLVLTFTIPVIFNVLPYMFRSIFIMKAPKWYLLIVAATITGFICVLLEIEAVIYLFLPTTFFGLAESIRVIIIAFRQKKKGVKIIGAGLLLFLVLVVIFTCAVIKDSQVSVGGGAEGLLVLIFFIISIFSIPISITIYLAYSISLTNKSLAKKLTEVEELSTKTIEQEKEKQSILANQNQVLEQQVTERTYEIREQKKVIEEKNKDIIDSINYAKRIQTAMLPDESTFKSVFNDSFVLYQPRDIVSGDFYYATEINGKKLVVAADCTGHGVPGALMSMVACNIINKLVHENEICDPKTLLEKLHEQLRHALKQDQKGSQNRDGMDAAVVMMEGEKIFYAAANRPMIYFDTDLKLCEVKPTKTPVGGSHIETISVQQHEFERKNIKQFFLFSDGFADQFGGPEGKKLMVSKFKMWLNDIVSIPCVEQHSRLSVNFENWKKNTEQVDDVLVIGIKLRQ